jgi:hypothetical protein
MGLPGIQRRGFLMAAAASGAVAAGGARAQAEPGRGVCLTLGASPFLQRHHASAEQIDASAAIHGTLEGLQFVDLPFGLPVAPRL